MTKSKVSIFILLCCLAFLGYLSWEYALSTKKNHHRVILVTIDTTRADRFGCYGNEQNITPNIDKIAKEGVVFLNAYCQIPTTDPSHASILTGTYPRTHGLVMNGGKIAKKDIPSLAEWFKKNGYLTAAITSRPILEPKRMGIKGFDYTNVPKNYKADSRRAQNTYGRAIEWLDKNYNKDIFLWVHFWDPHDEYEPPPPFNSKFNNAYKGPYKRTKEKHGFIASDKKRYTEDELQYIEALYNGEIAFVDYYVGKLMDYFDKKSEGKEVAPLFIITADHGETLGELQDRLNYAFRHAKFVRYNTIHVPLIIKWKGVLPSGKTFNEIVESVDIAPTIVELASNGKSKLEGCDGKSLKSLMQNGSKWNKKESFARRRFYPHKIKGADFLDAREYGVTTKEWFLVTNEKKGTELYHIESDPIECTDISDERNDIVDDLLGRLKQWKNNFPETTPMKSKLTPEEQKVLKSLGYL